MTAQEISSAGTSINKDKIPALFTRVDRMFGWMPGTVNLDLGGGRFDTAIVFLKSRGVENLLWDPFNRSDQHNAAVIRRVTSRPADSASISNVLNVLHRDDLIEGTIQMACDHLKHGGVLYITVHEGSGPLARTGVGQRTSQGWQRNQKLADYLPFVTGCFETVQMRGGLIIATRE